VDPFSLVADELQVVANRLRSMVTAEVISSQLLPLLLDVSFFFVLPFVPFSCLSLMEVVYFPFLESVTRQFSCALFRKLPIFVFMEVPYVTVFDSYSGAKCNSWN